ncbi:MAG: hypothetical protein HY696_13160 [Deltaproteobacteria bacterium]|nr:hypothetical protein [Deltaproteobacteria bacterium]
MGEILGIKQVALGQQDDRVTYCTTSDCRTDAVAIDADRGSDEVDLIAFGKELVVAYEGLRRKIAGDYGTSIARTATPEEVDHAQSALVRGREHAQIRFGEFAAAMRENKIIPVHAMAFCGPGKTRLFFRGQDGKELEVRLALGARGRISQVGLVEWDVGTHSMELARVAFDLADPSLTMTFETRALLDPLQRALQTLYNESHGALGEWPLSNQGCGPAEWQWGDINVPPVGKCPKE